MDTIASRTKLLIKNAGLSVNAAAKKCGVPQPSLNEIIIGKTVNPRSATIIKIAEGLGSSVQWILTGDATTTLDPEIEELANKLNDLKERDPGSYHLIAGEIWKAHGKL